MYLSIEKVYPNFFPICFWVLDISTWYATQLCPTRNFTWLTFVYCSSIDVFLKTLVTPQHQQSAPQRLVWSVKSENCRRNTYLNTPFWFTIDLRLIFDFFLKQHKRAQNTLLSPLLLIVPTTHTTTSLWMKKDRIFSYFFCWSVDNSSLLNYLLSNGKFSGYISPPLQHNQPTTLHLILVSSIPICKLWMDQNCVLKYTRFPFK